MGHTDPVLARTIVGLRVLDHLRFVMEVFSDLFGGVCFDEFEIVDVGRAEIGLIEIVHPA